ncbi:MAG: DEAD/DEAH box helicase family protein [Victivallaceae bacterium]|nr:DEAD/DEAH box helicase family protein [Victivallaceae bacterium]
MTPVLAFDAGSITLSGAELTGLPTETLKLFSADPRTGGLRARGCDYAAAVMSMRLGGIKFIDQARNYAPLTDLALAKELTPRPHQSEAFTAWRNAACRGVAALPTGSGKTILAVICINYLKRPTIVLVPTIDLLCQWAEVLEHFFGRPIGMLGGGERRIEPITVSTYDSALINMEFLGDRFAFLVADECHHLPGAETRLAAAMSIAPFRLGLSATPELPDDRAEVMTDLLGDIVCRIAINELEGKVLSPYVIHTVPVALDPEERERYDRFRSVYTAFIRRHQLTFRNSGDWGRFIGLCARSPEGGEVFQAYLEQKRISRGGRAKLRKTWELITRHADEQIIIFTADNETAYKIGRLFALPVITHRTKPSERKRFLALFREHKYNVLVTSKVLNEGVDVPSVGVGVILSGSASVREHVQRLGRILRPAPGKRQAELYELISENTGEESVSRRRREHMAYEDHDDPAGEVEEDASC